MLYAQTLAKFNRDFIKRLSSMLKEAEDFYPQLLSTVLVCHPPSFVSFFFRTVRTLMPQVRLRC